MPAKVGALAATALIVLASAIPLSAASADHPSPLPGAAPAATIREWRPLAVEHAPAGNWSKNVLLTNGTLCCATQTEPHAAVDSQGRLVVGWKEASSDTGYGQQVGWMYTHDGGSTWSAAKDLSGGSDIVFAVDENDAFHLSRLGGCNSLGNAICHYTSKDGGATWAGPVTASFETRNQLHDKNWVGTDHKGKVYMAYEPKDTDTVQGTVSTDFGATYHDGNGNQKDIAIADGSSSIAGPVIIGDRVRGGAAVCFIRGGNIYFDRTDDGKTWGTDVLIGAGSTSGPNIYRQIPLCMMVEDSIGNFYVAYPADGTAKDIVVHSSTDNGKTWSSKVTVNDVGTGDQWHVQGYMCVDSKDVVHIGWRDERSGQMEMMYSNSSDRGKTWSPNIKITDAPTSTSYERPGEYGALVCADDGTLYAVWADGRPDGNSNLDIYFAKMGSGGGGNSAPAAPAVTGPTSGVTNTSYSYNSSSVDPEADQVKITIDWGDGNSDTSALGPSGQNVQLSHRWTSEGTYTVKARGTDAKGAASAWGPALQVIIVRKGGGGQNNAPLAPTVTGPPTGQTSQTIPFSAQGTDLDNDQVRYTVDWGDTLSDTGPLVASGSAHAFSHSWSVAGKYAVRAMSTDAKGATSVWGTSISIDITENGGNRAPAPPAVTGPLSVLVGASEQYSVIGTDPDVDQLTYVVDWGDSSSDTSARVGSGVSATLPHAWAGRGSFQVKAKAVDEHSVESGWGAAITVVVTDTPDDGPPVIAHQPVREAAAGSPLRILSTVTDDVAVAGAALHYRPGDAVAWSSLPMVSSGDEYEATVPAGDVTGTELLYYIEADDAAGNLARDPAAGQGAPHLVKLTSPGGRGAPDLGTLLGGPTGLVFLIVIAVAVAALVAVMLLRRRRRNAGAPGTASPAGVAPFGQFEPQQQAPPDRPAEQHY